MQVLKNRKVQSHLELVERVQTGLQAISGKLAELNKALEVIQKCDACESLK